MGPLPDRFDAGDGGAHAWLDVVVVALVLVLLLAPHYVSVGVLLRLTLHQVKWEWRELREKQMVTQIRFLRQFTLNSVLQGQMLF